MKTATTSIIIALLGCGCVTGPVPTGSVPIDYGPDDPYGDGTIPAPQEELVKKLLEDMVEIPGAGFEMCKYEVSQALWFSIMGKNPAMSKHPDKPVEYVSWLDCNEFIEKLNALPDIVATGKPFRLPTDSEWVYACRAGADRRVGADRYYCRLEDGSEISLTEISRTSLKSIGKVAWVRENSNRTSHPVGQKQPNAFGLYDMLGNVWEWTGSRFHRARFEVANGAYRSIRGGGFDNPIIDCRLFDGRGSFISPIKEPDYRSPEIGFRLVR